MLSRIAMQLFVTSIASLLSRVRRCALQTDIFCSAAFMMAPNLGRNVASFRNVVFSHDRDNAIRRSTVADSRFGIEQQ